MAIYYLQYRPIMILYFWVKNMTLKELRNEYNLSQLEAANILGVPERTYRRYENNDSYGSEIKRDAFMKTLNEHCKITEEKGLLTIVLKIYEIIRLKKCRALSKN